jgi:CRP-like cAMP-binding protein
MSIASIVASTSFLRRCEEPMLDRGQLRPACAGCALGRASAPEACPFRETRCAAGERLLAQDEEPTSVWFIRQGAVLLSSSTESGDEVVCAMRGPGQLLGLEALRRRRTDCEAWALSDVVLCKCAPTTFQRWIGEQAPPVALMLDLLLDECVRRGQERGVVIGRAVARVARCLLESHRVEQRPLAVEQRVLARMLGMRPETLSRVLRRLRVEGALEAGRTLRVRDPIKLAAFADEVAEKNR